MTLPNHARVAGLALAGALTLAACGDDGTRTAAGGDELEVLTSFYPLQYVAERVGGEHVAVSTLTPPGAEPHDLELAPNAVARLGEADLVVYLSGFQAAVDDAVEQTAPAHLVDAAVHADDTQEEHEDEEAADDHSEEAADTHADETADEHSAEVEGDHAEDDHDGDPHLWLDPTRMAALAGDVADALADTDPGNAEAYRANADALATELDDLDRDFTAGLDQCEIRTIVVAHEAYGYLAEAYDLEQVGLSGIDPDAEPSPARLAEIGDVVRAEDVTTIFTESLVNPKLAETLAGDLGVETAVLDPLESLADEEKDYQQVMRENLAALEEALRCG